MTKENQFGPDGVASKGSGQTLRQRAEEASRGKTAGRAENVEALSLEETQQMLHELQVHQIELELQNDELRLTQGELEASRARYFDLYDLAPVGYFTLSETGLIMEANLTAAIILDVSRSALIKQPLTHFILPDDQDIYYQHRKLLFETGAPQVCEIRMVRPDAAPRWVRIDAVAAEAADGAPACRATMIDITERKQAEERMKKTLERLRKAFNTTIQVMVSAVERRDPYTAGHQIRSADLARTIAIEMRLSQEKIEGIRIAGSIHDIGKMSVPAEILSKPTKLSELEFSLIKEHARQGYEILKDVESSWPLAEMVYQHHERADGSGYPRGLKGEEIIIEARILAVADVVESMASHRPYRPALGLNAALAEIENNKGTLYDANAVDACLKLFREKGFQLEEG